MSAPTAIRVENLGKRYRIGPRLPYRALHDSLAAALSAPLRAIRSTLQPESRPASQNTIWALKEVSFEIRHGEVVGIIGRNGAGKSTLLKILSRITAPTVGTADLYGRVGSLLEVGTGFHPELTGRENIYLNGAILGMRRSEIEHKFDEIVAFAEVEKFIDTPVKHYSSGMYVRLAFSVAAHLEPEILLVDEVLAVGDVEFQKKCLGRMGEVARQGRTVLFVSHQLNAIQTLCPTCIWLDGGRCMEFGETSQVISRYLNASVSEHGWVSTIAAPVIQSPYFTPSRFCLVDDQLNPIQEEIRADRRFGILIEGETEYLNVGLTAGFAVYARSGELLFWSLHTDVHPDEWPVIHRGRNRLVAWIPEHFLNEGEYRVELILSIHYQEWISQPGMNAPGFTLKVRGGLSESPYWMMARPGFLAPVLRFQSLEA